MARVPQIVAKNMINHRLAEFTEKMNISEEQLTLLDEYREVLLGNKDEFRKKFYDFFFGIPESKTILEHVTKIEMLYAAWGRWFESLFRKEIDASYLEFIWSIGKRHVELNVEQRFTSLGFSLIRQFFHLKIRDEVPADKQKTISDTMDKLLDLNLFVMTAAYIETTVHCDIEVIKGMEDKIRNPVTVIGGSIMRLQRDAERPDHEKAIFEALIEQNKKLERIMRDIKKYTQLFESEPDIGSFSIGESVKRVLESLRSEKRIGPVRIDLNMDPEIPFCSADRTQIELVLHALIQNAVEATGPDNPAVSIMTRPEKTSLHNMEIEIFNTGTPPGPEDIDRLFSPFYSTKTMGTGFGLPFARLAVRKNYGKIALKPVPGSGTRVIVTLPLPD